MNQQIVAFRFAKPVPGLGVEYQERRYTRVELEQSVIPLPIIPEGFELVEAWEE